MKTPEQLAEEYALFGTEGVPDSIRKQQLMAKDRMAFLAGYQAAKPQWISVKERLPDGPPMVLANCVDGYELAYYGVYGQCWTNTLGTEHLNVTHWHALPEPPKEEK